MDQFLTLDLLQGASLEALARLATWLDVAPLGPWDDYDTAVYAYRAAIMRAEQRLAEGPRHLRWVQQLPPVKSKPVATWPAVR
jgi:hypothetical protein